MPRAGNAPASRRRRKRKLSLAKGFRGARGKLFRQAAAAVDRSMVLATIHRRQKKRDYRGLWITRLSAACRANGIAYNRFIEGLAKAHIKLNRKMLSEMAICDPAGFASIALEAKAAAKTA